MKSSFAGFQANFTGNILLPLESIGSQVQIVHRNVMRKTTRAGWISNKNLPLHTNENRVQETVKSLKKNGESTPLHLFRKLQVHESLLSPQQHNSSFTLEQLACSVSFGKVLLIWGQQRTPETNWRGCCSFKSTPICIIVRSIHQSLTEVLVNVCQVSAL